MDYESFLELAKKRRSIRDFKKDSISDDYIEKIIETARWAPSGFNSQPWEFVVVKKQALKEGIVKCIMDARGHLKSDEPGQGSSPVVPPHKISMGFVNAPVFIILFGDTRVREWGPPPVRSNDKRWKSVFTTTLALGFQYMHIAATSLGLASQWVSGVSNPIAESNIKQLLGVPDLMEIYDMMAVGYPATEPRGKQMRERTEMTHYDDCGGSDFRTDLQVKEYFSKR